MPVVNVSEVLAKSPMSRIALDNIEIGRLAAQHFLDRGFRRFGFVGYPDHFFSTERERGFRQLVESAGSLVDSYHERGSKLADSAGLLHVNERLRQWLRDLEPPVALFASHDNQGFQLTEACREEEISVPEEVAILGVDNDNVLCNLSTPPLSSIILPSRRIGHEAAKLLDRLMIGKEPKRVRPFAPSGIAQRQSSDILAIEDNDLKTAVRFIHANAHQPICVDDVVGQIALSRRMLERKFRVQCGRGVAQEIRRVHIERAKRMLSDSELSMVTVARHCGFTNGKHLSTVFQQEVGIPPTEYRRLHRSR